MPKLSKEIDQSDDESYRHTPRSRYHKMDSQMKKKIIKLVLTENRTVYGVAKELKLNYSTTKYIVRRYKRKNMIQMENEKVLYSNSSLEQSFKIPENQNENIVQINNMPFTMAENQQGQIGVTTMSNLSYYTIVPVSLGLYYFC